MNVRKNLGAGWLRWRSYPAIMLALVGCQRLGIKCRR